MIVRADHTPAANRADRGAVERPQGAIGWVPQRPAVYPRLTVAENVALGAQKVDPPLVTRALETVGLGDIDPSQVLGAKGAGLSGGQAQRVAIARALYRAWTTDAGAIVLDEPSSALDAASETLVCAALRAEARAGRAVLVVSHRPALIEAADRVVRMGVPA